MNAQHTAAKKRRWPRILAWVAAVVVVYVIVAVILAHIPA